MQNPYLYLLINHHFLVLISLQVCTLADFLYRSIYSLQSWVQKASVGDKTMNQNPLVRLFYPHNRSGSHLWLICIISAQLLINNGQLPKKNNRRPSAADQRQRNRIEIMRDLLFRPLRQSWVKADQFEWVELLYDALKNKTAAFPSWIQNTGVFLWQIT